MIAFKKLVDQHSGNWRLSRTILLLKRRVETKSSLQWRTPLEAFIFLFFYGYKRRLMSKRALVVTWATFYLFIDDLLSYLGRARPWASNSTYGTPSRTILVNKLCSILQYFWNAMFFTTGGSWWWSPIMIQRFNRDLPSWGFWSSKGMKVSISRICADSSIRMLSYLKPNAV